jgi:hypothetical protein
MPSAEGNGDAGNKSAPAPSAAVPDIQPARIVHATGGVRPLPAVHAGLAMGDSDSMEVFDFVFSMPSVLDEYLFFTDGDFSQYISPQAAQFYCTVDNPTSSTAGFHVQSVAHAVQHVKKLAELSAAKAMRKI